MLAPHELKNREFTKSLRGYSTVEVDEHIDFIIEKYSELYRENDELEKKLRLTEAQLDAMKGEEESIRSALVNAQKASTRIINEANERADVIMRSAKNSCDRLIAEFKANIKKETERLNEARKEVAAFKAALFEEYQAHIELIEKIAPDIAPVSSDNRTAEELSAAVIERIKNDLAGKESVISGSGVPYAADESAEAADYDTSDVSVTTPAEAPIPKDIFAEPEKDEERSVRDADGDNAAAPSSDELVTHRSRVTDDGRGGIVDSIKKLNSTVSGSDDDDEEFLRMLKNVSDSDSDAESEEEFLRVYDGKKK
ncbi:MAG: DivIVA domain-containing protein [Firmicutes bacterium]|uniref:DivIVA domain-containing protein n=1 Tax=Candidatus Colimorpha enterica TaxID=3083063 RepID=A0AAE3FI35_9BACT|nr:DivIVA domain-containing protein [Candidatus Colimorpha enterica]